MPAEAEQLSGQDVRVFEVRVPHGTHAYAVEFGGARLVRSLPDQELSLRRDLLRCAGLDRLRVTMAIGGEDCPATTTRLTFLVGGSSSTSRVRLPQGRPGPWSTTIRAFGPGTLDAWVALSVAASLGVGVPQSGRPARAVPPLGVTLRVAFLSTGDHRELDRLLPPRLERPTVPPRSR